MHLPSPRMVNEQPISRLVESECFFSQIELRHTQCYQLDGFRCWSEECSSYIHIIHIHLNEFGRNLLLTLKAKMIPTLFQLIAADGDVAAFSPHVWKTKLDLA